jgi:hypothetical protein
MNVNLQPVQQVREQVSRTPLCAFHAMLTGSAATLATAPSPTSNPTGSGFASALLKSIILTNTDSSARTVTLYVIPASGSAADAQTIAKDMSIAAKTTYEFIYPDTVFPLNAGEFIQGLASTTNVVSCRVNLEYLSL